MDKQTWTEVDSYLAGELLAPDAALDAALESNVKAGLPAIDVSPTQGKLLWLLATLRGAAKILEVGTLGGYSTIWLARALAPGGRLITLELEPKHAQVARANLQRAGLSEVAEVRVGPALESLAKLEAEDAGPFDVIFIDADKRNNAVYLEWALKLAKVGSLIVVDNVVRSGAVIDAESSDANIRGSRALFARMKAEPRLEATAIQTVGAKGYDGLAIALVVS